MSCGVGTHRELEPFLAGIADDFDEYLTRMSHPAAWGGEPEMLMASHVTRRPITVYRLVGGSAEPIVTYGEQLLASGVPPVHLLWSGAHYDLLLPAPSGGGGATEAA
jgi:OTU domain-containing protein 6